MPKQRHNKIHISWFPIEVNVWKSDHNIVSLTYLHSWSWFPGDPVSAGTYWPVDLPSIDECPHWLCCCVRGLKFLDCECCSVMYNKNLAWIFDLMFLLLYKHNYTKVSFEGWCIWIERGITRAFDTADIDW